MLLVIGLIAKKAPDTNGREGSLFFTINNRTTRTPINYKFEIMTSSERAALKTKISEAIAEMHEKMKGLEEMAKPISPENSIGRVSRMDAINNKSVAEAALRSAKQKLSKLKIALSKIDSPEFGICVFCKNPIPAARLMYMPESTRCVRCADR